MKYFYELVIVYKNGKRDEYFSRTKGHYWESEERVNLMALNDIIEGNPEVFREIKKNKKIAGFHAVKKVVC